MSGCDPNNQDINGTTPLVETLLRYKQGEETTCYQIVEHLLSFGANPNLCMSSGVTPLMFATLTGDVNIVSLLLWCGANPNTTLDVETAFFPMGSTAFSIACVWSDYLLPLFLVNGMMSSETIQHAVRWLRDRKFPNDSLIGVAGPFDGMITPTPTPLALPNALPLALPNALPLAM
jgi:hypothetical protein